MNIPHLKKMISSRKVSKAIYVEGLYSMTGQVSPLTKIDALLDTNSLLVIDEAHSFGIVPIVPLSSHVLRIVPMGKAIGLNGAVVVGSEMVIDSIVQWNSALTYSTALSPIIASAGLQSLRVMAQEKWRLARIRSLIMFAKECFIKHKVNLFGDERSPIQMVKLNANSSAKRITELLAQNNIIAPVIRYPTVAKGSLWIRLSFHYGIKKIDIVRLAKLLCRYEKSINQ